MTAGVRARVCRAVTVPQAREGAIVASTIERRRRLVCRWQAMVRVGGAGALQVAAVYLLPAFSVAALVFVALCSVIGPSGCPSEFGLELRLCWVSGYRLAFSPL